jgi:hypothetical protein
MKKLIMALVLTLALSGSAFAVGTVQENCGCGLGGMVLGESNNSLLINLAASCLNGLCGNQTFGITTGTLGCQKFEGFVQSEQVKEYVADNMDILAKDIAMGNGESLEALADLMNVEEGSRAQLYATLQSNFNNIFTSEAVTAEDVVNNIAIVVS